MASEQNYFETTSAQKWVDEVNELLDDTNGTLKNATQLLKDIGRENSGTLGSDLQNQGDAFIDAFTEMAHGFASCVAVVTKHIANVLKAVASDEKLLDLAGKAINVGIHLAGV